MYPKLLLVPEIPYMRTKFSCHIRVIQCTGSCIHAWLLGAIHFFPPPSWRSAALPSLLTFRESAVAPASGILLLLMYAHGTLAGRVEDDFITIIAAAAAVLRGRRRFFISWANTFLLQGAHQAGQWTASGRPPRPRSSDIVSGRKRVDGGELQNAQLVCSDAARMLAPSSASAKLPRSAATSIFSTPIHSR